ncbi:L,D-transpeptidase [Rhizobium lemnae]|uniref:L,D-transpeptidase n=1 Tax=Rhizobium lemnae TaxID=1214924 RepID=A0ABV8EBL7_9HYPH|nr:L,D-transpeptidase [Rhizobium lemnae]MCJ8506510.1 L,D-transpeptidase [Rhizobium lemnae]
MPSRAKSLVLMLCATMGLTATEATAQDRYRERPPVVVSPDLTAPWVMQLGGQVRAPDSYRVQPMQRGVRDYRDPATRDAAQPRYAYPSHQPAYVVPRTQTTQIRPNRMPAQQAPVQQAAMQRVPVIKGQIEPQFLPQMVAYQTEHKPGTIVIDTNNRFLYLVMEGGQAKRYGVGVGKPGFEWAGTHTVTRKAEWPDWHPPKEMIAREAAKGHYLPVKMEGGPENPLGARALYLGSTLYRIHGTNAPWTIGSAVSSGCIRMRNEDVTDLYGRVNVGTKVIVM